MRQSMILLICADSITLTTRKQQEKKEKKKNKNVFCHVSHVTHHMSLKPTAKATHPPSAYSPYYAQYSCLLRPKKLNQLFSVREFQPPSEQKLKILTPLSLYYFYLRNLFSNQVYLLKQLYNLMSCEIQSFQNIH